MENRENTTHMDGTENTAEEQENKPEFPTTESQPKKNIAEKLLSGLKAAFAPHRWKKTAAILGTAAILLAAGGVILQQNSAASVAARYCKGMLENPKAASQMTAYDRGKYITTNYADDAAFFEKMSNEMHEEIESWNDYYDALKSEYRDSLEDEFGKYKIFMDVTKVRDISTKKMSYEKKDLIASLEKAGSFDSDEIKAAKEVTIKGKIVGEDKTDRQTIQVYVVKMSNGWKVLAADSVSDD